MRYWFLLLALLAVICVGGCGGSSEHVAEQEILARAPEYIGDAERYQVALRGVGDDRVAFIQVTGYGVKPDANQVIDPLVLTLRDVRFSRQPFRIISVGQATFTGRVSEVALNTAIRKQQPPPSPIGLNQVRVELRQRLVRALATVPVVAVEVPVTTTGRLRIDDGIRIDYAPETLEVGHIGIPRTVQGLLATRINPLIDLSGLRFTPTITEVTVDRGEIIVSGTAALR